MGKLQGQRKATMSIATNYKTRTYMAFCLLGIMLVAQGCTSNMVLRERSEKHLRAKRYNKAELELTRALSQEPEDWRAQYLMGIVQLKLEHPADAQMQFERAEALAPDHFRSANIRDGLAESLFRQKKNDQLKKALAKSANGNGDVRDFLRQARYLQKIGDPDGAEMALVKSTKVARTTDPSPYLAMASFYKSLGLDDKSLHALRIAYGIQPKNKEVIKRLKQAGIQPRPELAMKPPK
jgi:tetratricopeptide (TPR) repeat protein